MIKAIDFFISHGLASTPNSLVHPEKYHLFLKKDPCLKDLWPCSQTIIKRFFDFDHVFL